MTLNTKAGKSASITKRGLVLSLLSFLFFWVPEFSVPGQTRGITVDHTCADTSRIPDEWIRKVQSSIKLHFAHTSHGLQLIEGLRRLTNPSLPVYDPRLTYNHRYRTLPESGGLCILGGQKETPYAVPEQYWKEGGGLLTRRTLKAFPGLNVSMFCWCRELDRYSEKEVDDYLKTLSALEEAHPGVVFVYMTGNAQAKGPGAHNRYLRNQQIRKYCRNNHKILYDFADLDVWYGGEKWTYTYEGKTSPKEHPHYNGDDHAHTTYESCEIKAKALWWLLARIAGWHPEETDNRD